MIGGWVPAIPIALLIVLLTFLAIVVVPGRTERNDDTGRKVYAKFLLVVVFLFVFAGLFSAYGVTTSLTGLIGSHGNCTVNISSAPGASGSPGSSSSPGSGSFSFGPGITVTPGSGSGGSQSGPGITVMPQATMCAGSFTSRSSFDFGPGTSGDTAARGAILFGLLLIVSIGFIWTQGHAAARLFSSDEVRRGPPGRVLDAYLFSTAFVAILIFVAAAIGAAYAVFQLIGPGTFDAAGRGAAAQQLISGGVLAILAILTVGWHVQRAWKLHAEVPPVAPPSTTPATPEPAAPEPVPPRAPLDPPIAP